MSDTARARGLAVPVLVMVVLVSGSSFAEDMSPGEITLASTSDGGMKANRSNWAPSLSGDGTAVAFYSHATNLDPADTDLVADVYVYSVVRGQIILASTSDGGIKANGFNYYPSLSADGTAVAFYSAATNLHPADRDGIIDVYVKDLVSGETTLASTSGGGIKGNGYSLFPSLSADGTAVAFYGVATNLHPADIDTLADVYVKDLVSGQVTLASTSDGGIKGNGSSGHPSLSADGTAVAFRSLATNLDPADTDPDSDVYVKDLVSGQITLASTSDDGVKANGDSFDPSLSADGTAVAFWTLATNLGRADTETISDVYVKDLMSGQITLASTSDAGVKANGDSWYPSLSADGTAVAFYSDATNLQPVDADSLADIYVKDLVRGQIILASTADRGIKGNRSSLDPSLSARGRKVAFISYATNLDPADPDTRVDVYVKALGRG